MKRQFSTRRSIDPCTAWRILPKTASIYSGYDKQVHASDGQDFYVDDSLWDTYRSEHPWNCYCRRRRQLDYGALLHSHVRTEWLDAA